MIRAVFFDVDGVLLDSLPQHLAICRDKAREYRLRLKIPDVAGFRRLIERGVTVSPMREFFLAVGFPEALAERATVDYQHEFATRYRPPPFPGIDPMLDRLRAAGLTLGLVTANVASVVEPALGPSMRHFDLRCRFYKAENSTVPLDKVRSLADGARALDVALGACVFVGDQPADAAAARDAGCRFLGVGYGWGFDPGRSDMALVPTVPAIAEFLLAWTKSAP